MDGSFHSDNSLSSNKSEDKKDATEDFNGYNSKYLLLIFF